MAAVGQAININSNRRAYDPETHSVLANSPVRGSREWWIEVENKLASERESRAGSEEILLRLVDEDDPDIPDKLRRAVQSALQGIQHGYSPELCKEGVGGTYFLFDHRGKKTGVFKPQDEEPFHVNNPKGFRPRHETDAGIKHGILVGEASVRECVAYLLDHNGFAGVPATVLCLCEHEAFTYNERFTPRPSRMIQPALSTKLKLGSFQKYVKHDGDSEDIVPSLLSRFPVHEVQKIALLDIRLVNTDRHGGNILWREESSSTISLVPIDHGFTLPANLSEAFFAWLIWPQAMLPFDASCRAYIQSLDVESDIQLLQEKFGRTIDGRHFRILRVTTLLLKLAAPAGLSPGQVGEMMSRDNLEEPCLLEQLCTTAELTCGHSSDDRVFLGALQPLLQREISRILTRDHN